VRALALEITKAGDKRFLKALIFSPAGHGKTHFLGTAEDDPRTSPMLVLDFEGGHETLSGLDIDVAEIRAWDDYNEAYELLTSDSADNRYKSVGVDSASETAQWALLQLLAKEGPSRRDPDLLEMRDYGRAGTQVRRLLREFRDLPLHVFYTSHAKEIEERGVGKVKVPAMFGQLAEEVAGLMSVVGYLAITEGDEGDTERVLLLENNPGFRTKARVPWGTEAPEELWAPTVTNVLDAVGVTDKTRKRSTKNTKKGSDE
jgi:hypothetical protein